MRLAGSRGSASVWAGSVAGAVLPAGSAGGRVSESKAKAVAATGVALLAGAAGARRPGFSPGGSPVLTDAYRAAAAMAIPSFAAGLCIRGCSYPLESNSSRLAFFLVLEFGRVLEPELDRGFSFFTLFTFGNLFSFGGPCGLLHLLFPQILSAWESALSLWVLCSLRFFCSLVVFLLQGQRPIHTGCARRLTFIEVILGIVLWLK